MAARSDVGQGGLAPDLLLLNTPLKDYGRVPKRNDFTLPTLGLGYIATCAEAEGFTVEVVDAEALGLGLAEAAELVNRRRPRWLGMNLLAPTFQNSVDILRRVSLETNVMLGGHQAKAMPGEILRDPRIPRIDAMVLGEGETRVPRILADTDARERLPKVYWRERGQVMMPSVSCTDPEFLAPDLNNMPFVDRRHLHQDPYLDGGVLEAAMVASRGCPFDCSFCGAAVSANPDVTVRMRSPGNILAEIGGLRKKYGVERVRFVDDLFLANRKVIRETLGTFVAAGSTLRWDATGRINVLASAPDDLVDLMARSGCREVALGIESGSDRLLRHIDKKITVQQVLTTVSRLCRSGIDVKGYFILGLPTETRAEMAQTLDLISRLRELAAPLPGSFRCSVFEYRPYPGTPDWDRLVSAGFPPEAMIQYDPVTTTASDDALSPDRDEFNFSTGLQFGEVPVSEVRRAVAEAMRRQRER